MESKRILDSNKQACRDSRLGCPPVTRFRIPSCTSVSFVVMIVQMFHKLRFLWNATKGHHLAPWRSPYLLWRIETYTGVKMTQIGFLEFWEFMWRERHELWRFLRWTGEMERYVHPRPKNS